MGGLTWDDFMKECSIYRRRFAYMDEAKELLASYLSTSILLCWFHVKAAWHDSLLPKVIANVLTL